MPFSSNLEKQINDPSKVRQSQIHIVMLVAGSFQGDPAPSLEHPITTPYPLDIDRLEPFFSHLQPKLTICLEANRPPLELSFKNLDQFHPDQLIPSVSNPRIDVTRITPPDIHNKDTSKAFESDQQTLRRLLGERPLNATGRDREHNSINQTRKRTIESVVQQLTSQAMEKNSPVPSCIESEFSESTTYTTHQLRYLLHDAAFQTLESRWRSLDWLVHNNINEEVCSIFCINIPSWDAPESPTKLIDLLKQQVMALNLSERKLILIIEKTFGPNHNDIALLKKLGQLVGKLDAIIIAAADSCFLEPELSDEHHQIWQDFRRSYIADSIMLTLPRLLLRRPYGAQYDPIDTFDFEELDEHWKESDLLWGNPSYTLGLILADHFLGMKFMNEGKVSDCPAFAFQRDGERCLQPCTEYLYHDDQLKKLLELGLVPFVGSCHYDRLQAPWLQTLSTVS
jgi:type VI secretion system protein ImpC